AFVDESKLTVSTWKGSCFFDNTKGAFMRQWSLWYDTSIRHSVPSSEEGRRWCRLSRQMVARVRLRTGFGELEVSAQAGGGDGV
ncbi:hypothetical protein E2562_033468, partial [Oryza meyeriana var. granulata]